MHLWVIRIYELKEYMWVKVLTQNMRQNIKKKSNRKLKTIHESV